MAVFGTCSPTKPNGTGWVLPCKRRDTPAGHARNVDTGARVQYKDATSAVANVAFKPIEIWLEP